MPRPRTKKPPIKKKAKSPGKGSPPSVVMPKSKLLERLGIKERDLAVNCFDSSYIKNLYMEYLEQSALLYEFTLKRWKLAQHGIDEGKEIDEIKVAEDIIKKRAVDIMTVVLTIRRRYLFRVSESKESQNQCLAACKEDPIYWFTWWVWTHDPRLESGLPSDIPMILFDQQEVLLKSILSWQKNGLNGLIVKSREEGISWLAMAVCVYNFIFARSFTGLVISQKEDFVDLLGSKAALFGKFRHILYSLPLWMRPEKLGDPNNGFDNKRRIVNPDTGSEMLGGIGNNPGTSNRASMVFIDEAQGIEKPGSLDDSLESVSKCIISVGTPQGMNHFGKKRHSGRVTVREIGWEQDPRKNPAWRENKMNYDCFWRQYIEATCDPIAIAQNYDRDFNASVEGSFIPDAWIRSAVNLFDKPDDYEATTAGFDVSTGRYNKAIYIMRKGVYVFAAKESPFKTVNEGAWWAIDEGESDGITKLNYDGDGLGMSLMGLFENSDRKFRFAIKDVHGAQKASDTMISSEGKRAFEKFGNRRAEVWWGLRERFRKTYEHVTDNRYYPKCELISIQNDTDLISQLAQPKIMINERGKIYVESKKSMQGRNVMSPDKADALAYCFWDIEGGDVASGFRYFGQNSNVIDKPINFEIEGGRQFASLYFAADGGVSAIVAMWKAHRTELIIHSEYFQGQTSPEHVINTIKTMAHNDISHISEWIANEEVFDSVAGSQNIFEIYRKQKVSLRRNYTNDPRGSIVMLNQMLEKGVIKINKQCSQLIMQLAQWDHGKSGRPDPAFALCVCLSQIITRMRKASVLSESEIEKLPVGGK